jgi:sugar/nucleoside kinase (ribokinase family)
LIITLDTCGAYICTENFSKSISGFRINLVEATGAGDGFNAGVLFGILSHIKHTTNRRQKLIDLNVNQLEEIVNRANAIGAIICTKTGAMQSLPSKQEVDEFIQVYS